MTMMTIGIDLGETVCSLAGLDEEGRVVFRKRVRRDRLCGFLATPSAPRSSFFCALTSGRTHSGGINRA